MSENNRDEIDEVLSKYLPSKLAESRPAEDDTGSETEDQTPPGQDADRAIGWVKTNLLFILVGGLLVWGLASVVTG